MATYTTREQRAADMERATTILTDAAKSHGMVISTSQDVIRVKDTDGTTVLSLHAPYWLSSSRFFVDGLYVPYQSSRIVGRSRYASKRVYWRSTATKAALEAVKYIRRQNKAEAIESERSRVLAERHERRSKYEREAQGRYVSDSDVHALAKAAYRDGYRTGDDGIDATVALAVLKDDERLSDSLWYDLLWNSFEPALRAVS